MTTPIPLRRILLFASLAAAVACSSETPTGPVRSLAPSDILGRWVLHDIDGNAPSSGITYPGVASDTLWFLDNGISLEDEHDVANPMIPQVQTWWTIRDSLVMLGPPDFQPDTFRLQRTREGTVLTLIFNWRTSAALPSGRTHWNYIR